MECRLEILFHGSGGKRSGDFKPAGHGLEKGKERGIIGVGQGARIIKLLAPLTANSP